MGNGNNRGFRMCRDIGDSSSSSNGGSRKVDFSRKLIESNKESQEIYKDKILKSLIQLRSDCYSDIFSEVQSPNKKAEQAKKVLEELQKKYTDPDYSFDNEVSKDLINRGLINDRGYIKRDVREQHQEAVEVSVYELYTRYHDQEPKIGDPLPKEEIMRRVLSSRDDNQRNPNASEQNIAAKKQIENVIIKIRYNAHLPGYDGHYAGEIIGELNEKCTNPNHSFSDFARRYLTKIGLIDEQGNLKDDVQEMLDKTSNMDIHDLYREYQKIRVNYVTLED